MILEQLKLETLVFQIRYDNAYLIWDHAGAIALKLCEIWPDLELVEGQPQQQSLRSPTVHVETGLKQSTLTLSSVSSLDQRKILQVSNAFEIWRAQLSLSKLKRMSTRGIFERRFEKLEDARSAIQGLRLIDWPMEKVFDQTSESELNVPEIRYKFEDKASFAFLTVKVEQVKYEAHLDPKLFEKHSFETTRNKFIVDFDRGVTGEIIASDIRIDEWIKSFQHLLRRDIEKVIGDKK